MAFPPGGVVSAHAITPPVNPGERMTARLGVGAAHGGHGYGTEMARRLVAYGFAELPLNRIAADVESPASASCTRSACGARA
jgi:RimJ/RimL family protein N-acetyltransferase